MASIGSMGTWSKAINLNASGNNNTQSIINQCIAHWNVLCLSLPKCLGDDVSHIFCQITCKATWPGTFLDPYAFTRARWMFGVTLLQEFKLYWKNYIFQVINWQMDSQDTANNMNKIASQKKTVFLVRHLQRSCFLYIIPQGNLLPKIKCLAVSCQRNFSFHPPFMSKT